MQEGSTWDAWSPRRRKVGCKELTCKGVRAGVGKVGCEGGHLCIAGAAGHTIEKQGKYDDLQHPNQLGIALQLIPVQNALAPARTHTHTHTYIRSFLQGLCGSCYC